MQLIAAPLQSVGSCLAAEMRTKDLSSFAAVVETPKYVQLKMGDTSLRLFDLEEAVGGTLVTTYTSPFQTYIDKAKADVDSCNVKLTLKP